MDPSLVSRRNKTFVTWAIAVTIVVEAITCYLRFGTGASATEFNKTAPLLLQIHHMFWSLPVFLMLPFCWQKPRISGALLGIAVGFIISDLMHHFLILPLTVGNTGWHWP